MLLNVWDAYWENMQRLEAEEQRTAFVLAQAADPGWQMDREALFKAWGRLTAPKLPPRPTKDLRGRMIQFAGWFRQQWQGHGFGAGVTTNLEEPPADG